MKKIKKEYYFILVILVLFIVLTMLVVSGKVDAFDKAAFDSVIYFKNNYLTKFLYTITTLATTSSVIMILVVTGIIFYKKKILSDLKYPVINVIAAVSLMEILKHIIKRSRPFWKWAKQGGFSYPSGHTITAFALYGSLMLIINKRVVGKKKYILMTILSLMVLLTALSRVYLGVHYLTDVLASFLLGTIILIISNLFINREFNNDKNKSEKRL